MVPSFQLSSALAVQIALDILDELIAEGDRLQARIRFHSGKDSSGKPD
jgi:hypothetical protein